MSWLLDTNNIAGKLGNIASKVQSMAENVLLEDDPGEVQRVLEHNKRLKEEVFGLT